MATLTKLFSPKPSRFSLSPFPATPNFSHLLQHCTTHRLRLPGLATHARIITSAFTPTTFLSNCLINFYLKTSCLHHALHVFDQMPHPDPISYNALLSALPLPAARSLFLSMPTPDTVSFNTLISAYTRHHNPHQSVTLFHSMARTGIAPDHTTFAAILKSCSMVHDRSFGTQLHGMSVKNGLDSHLVAACAIVDMYGKCNDINDAMRMFRTMPERNWVAWSAVIAGCAQNEMYAHGLELFREMQLEGGGVSQAAYASVFRSCAGIPCVKAGAQFHGHALKRNYSEDVIVGTAILDMYAKCECLVDAVTVFRWLPTRTLQCWNAIVVGFTRNGRCEEAMELFRGMCRSGVGVNEIGLSSALNACAEVKGYWQGLQCHCLAVKSDLVSDICVRNAMLDMYGKCGALLEACGIFAEMERRDGVSWNAIITALEQNARWDETLKCFDQMLHCGMEPDEFTYGSILKACAGLKSLDAGVKVHDRIIKTGLGLHSFVGTALVDMYCKCGSMDEAMKIHRRMDSPSTVSWNAIISGFSLNKPSEEAQKIFFQMLEMGLKPDNFTYATVLDTCANLATINLGRQIHAQTIKQELQRDAFISSTLVDLYAKCGNMQDSLLMFEKTAARDFVSWNALICGYAQHGFAQEALKMFERMQSHSVRPNHTTFISVLRACGHVGLVDEGTRYFNLMKDHYKIEPQLEHYSCMIDMIGRNKGVSEALKLLDDMPLEADAVIWRTLLGVCKIHGDVEVAELAANNILLSEPEDSSAYILLSNIYAEAGEWEKVSKLRVVMRRSRLKKEPGCSWIEVKNEMHAFLIRDKAHPRCSEIYAMLNELIREMKLAGYSPGIDYFIDEEDDESKDQQEQFGNV